VEGRADGRGREDTVHLVLQRSLRDDRDVEVDVCGVPEAAEEEAEVRATLQGEVPPILTPRDEGAEEDEVEELDGLEGGEGHAS